MDPEKAPDKRKKRPKSYAEASKGFPSMEATAATPTPRRRATSDSSASPTKTSIFTRASAAVRPEPATESPASPALEPAVPAPSTSEHVAPPAALVPEWPVLKSPVAASTTLASPVQETSKPGADDDVPDAQGSTGLRQSPKLQSPKATAQTKPVMSYAAMTRKNLPPPKKHKDDWAIDEAAEQAWEAGQQQAIQRAGGAAQRLANRPAAGADQKSATHTEKKQATEHTEKCGKGQPTTTTAQAASEKRVSNAPELLQAIKDVVKSTPAKKTREPRRKSRDSLKLTLTPKKLEFSPQKSTFSPQKSTFSPSKSTFSPQKSTYSPQKSTTSSEKSASSPSKLAAPLGTPKLLAEVLPKKQQSPQKSSTTTPKKARQPEKAQTMPPPKSPQKKVPLTWAGVVKGEKAAVVPHVAPRIQPATPFITPAVPVLNPVTPQKKQPASLTASSEGDAFLKEKTPQTAKKDKGPRAKKDGKKDENTKVKSPQKHPQTGTSQPQEPPASAQSNTWGRIQSQASGRSEWQTGQTHQSGQSGRQRSWSNRSGPGGAQAASTPNLSWSQVASNPNYNPQQRPNFDPGYLNRHVPMLPVGNLAMTLKKQQDEELLRAQQDQLQTYFTPQEQVVLEEAAEEAAQDTEQKATAAAAAAAAAASRQEADLAPQQPTTTSSVNVAPQYQPGVTYQQQQSRVSDTQLYREQSQYYQPQESHQTELHQPQLAADYQQQATYYPPSEQYQEPAYYPGYQYNQTTYYLPQPTMQYQTPGYQPQAEYYQAPGYHQPGGHLQQQPYHDPRGPTSGPVTAPPSGTWYPDQNPMHSAPHLSMDNIRNVPPRPEDIMTGNRGRSPTASPMIQAREASAYTEHVKRERERSAMRRGIAKSNFHMWNYQPGSDVLVKCGRSQWYAHRHILEEKSPWFKHHLPPPDPTGDGIEFDAGSKGCTVNELGHAMWFMYHDRYEGGLLNPNNPIDGGCVFLNVYQFICGRTIHCDSHMKFAVKQMEQIADDLAILLPRMYRDLNLRLLFVPVERGLRMMFDQGPTEWAMPMRIALAKLMDVCMLYFVSNPTFNPYFKLGWLGPDRIFDTCFFDNHYFYRMGHIPAVPPHLRGNASRNDEEEDDDDGATIVGEPREEREAEVVVEEEDDDTPKAERQRDAEAGDDGQASQEAGQQTESERHGATEEANPQVDTPSRQPAPKDQEEHVTWSSTLPRRHIRLTGEEIAFQPSNQSRQQRSATVVCDAPAVHAQAHHQVIGTQEHMAPVADAMSRLQLHQTHGTSAPQAETPITGSQEVDVAPRIETHSPERVSSQGIQSTQHPNVPGMQTFPSEPNPTRQEGPTSRMKTPSPEPTRTVPSIPAPTVSNRNITPSHHNVRQTSKDSSPESTRSFHHRAASDGTSAARGSSSAHYHNQRPLHFRLPSRQLGGMTTTTTTTPSRSNSPALSAASSSSKYHTAVEEFEGRSFSASSSKYLTAAEDQSDREETVKIEVKGKEKEEEKEEGESVDMIGGGKRDEADV